METEAQTHPKTNAIITYLDGNCITPFVTDFIPTLFGEGKFSGHLYILAYELTAEQKNMIMDAAHLPHGSESGQITIIDRWKYRPVYNQRVDDIPTLLETVKEERVMTIDAGDVWFQAPFEEVFDLCDAKIGFVEEKYGATHHWMRLQLQKLPKNKEIEAFTVLDGHPCRASGMICGSRLAVKHLYELMKEKMAWLEAEFFGIDMLACNLAAIAAEKGDPEAHKLGNTLEKVPNKYSWVVLPTSNDTFIDREGPVLCDSDFKPIPIVHNVGGERGEARIFKDGRASLRLVLDNVEKQADEKTGRYVKMVSMKKKYPFTSICIPEAPNDRSRELTKMCTMAIERFTDQEATPYEILTESRGTSVEAANFLADRAKGEYIVFLSNDAFVTRRWLENLHMCWEMIGKRGEKCGQLSTYFTGSVGNVQDLTSNKYDPRAIWLCPRIVWVCVMTRKEDFLKVGGMDPRFRGSFSDDDISIRYLRNGFKNFVCPQIILHIGRVGFDGSHEKFVQDLKDGEQIIINKWGTQWKNEFKTGMEWAEPNK